MPKTPEPSVDNMLVPAPDFDVRDFARTAAGSYRETLNLEAYAAHPLSASTLRILGYLHNVERATMTHLRGVLVTATHKDARITAFLTTWAFEKYWIADALDQIVQAHPAAADIDETFRTPQEKTIRESIFANIVGVPMIAVHMALGTIDEWLTQSAYKRILELEPHNQLRETIEAMLVVKRRQLSFFEAQARHRLAESRTAMRVARRRMRHTAWPVGSTAEPKANTAFYFSQLFSTAPALISELDQRIDTLPGLSGLGLIRKAAQS